MISQSQAQHSLAIDDSTSQPPEKTHECLPKNTSTPIHDNKQKEEVQACNESFHSLDSTLLPKAESSPPQHNQKTRADHGDETPLQPPIEGPKPDPESTVQEEPFFPDRSRTDLLPGGSQPTPSRSIIASLKTLVTESFIDNLPRTDPAKTITKLTQLTNLCCSNVVAKLCFGSDNVAR